MATAASLVVYQVFARHGPRYGTLARVAADVERLRGLGVDALYLLPVQPTGAVARKGSLGSPYAAKDYRALDPALGTLADLAALVGAVHGAGMLLLFDAVLNHTAKDSVLAAAHPEWFLPGLASSVPKWTDIAEFDYGCAESDALVAEVTDCLRHWLALGVDGFRCDVASVLPEHAWRRILGALRAEFPRSVWISESFKPRHAENAGRRVLADAVLLRYFDATYDYTLYPLWQNVVRGAAPLQTYVDHLRLQLIDTPRRLRFIENHDTARLVCDLPPRHVRLWLAFFALLPGALLVYHGLETYSPTTPSLFDPDAVADGAEAFADLAAVLALKRETRAYDQTYFLQLEPTLVLVRRDSQTHHGLYAVLSFGAAGALPPATLPAGAAAVLTSADLSAYRFHSAQAFKSYASLVLGA